MYLITILTESVAIAKARSHYQNCLKNKLDFWGNLNFSGLDKVMEVLKKRRNNAEKQQCFGN